MPFRIPPHAALSHQQVADLSRPFWPGGQLALLGQLGVEVLNGGAATCGAHAAHPMVCGGGAGGNASFWDCRHFCQPGPVDLWNEQLLDAIASGSSTRLRA